MLVPMAGVDAEKDPVWMTSAMLKAYTHPLRRQILRLFARREYLRAADIATELDVAPNSASFHLRTLADAGLIVEAPDRARDRRDRVWTHVKGAMSVGDPEHPVADAELGGAVLRAIASEHQDLVQRVIAWSPEYFEGRSTEIHALFQQRTIRLTDAEFSALVRVFDEAASAADEAHDEKDPDGRFWQIDLIAADDTI